MVMVGIEGARPASKSARCNPGVASPAHTSTAGHARSGVELKDFVEQPAIR
jgi:hypothetical protein